MKIMRNVVRVAAAVALVPLLSSVAVADTGAEEYTHACAACHGVDGKGTGPMMDLISVSIPDLTQLAKNNDGMFPMLDVIHTIDGRSGVRGHGSEMPIWGDRFAADAGDAMGPYGSEVVVRGRILSLAYYLEGIQE